jgi:glycosyltransferase involved in cell wall biosynthesis
MDRADEHSGRARPERRASLSACVIACDEQAALPACLASVAFCDEIVLVDSGSVDGTVELALAAGARVVRQPWLGFAAQRNVAIDNARCDWIIEVDADERVTPALRDEIEAFLEDPPPGTDLAGLPLRDVLLGHALGPSAKYPKYRHRMLRRGSYRHDERRTVHEGLIPVGPVHPFSGDLLHLLAESWSEAVGDAWRYAALEAGQLHAPRTPRAVFVGAVVRPLGKFVYRLTVDGGWRDGPYGLVKIALDCASDAIVWLRHMSGLRGGARGESGTPTDGHYGVRRRHGGSVRVVAIAAGSASRARAVAWLIRARQAGLDVALIADTRSEERALRTRSLTRMGPIQLIRALEAEQQLRTIDVVVTFGMRARLQLAIVPRALHGIVQGVSEQEDPSAVCERAEAARAVEVADAVQSGPTQGSRSHAPRT